MPKTVVLDAADQFDWSSVQTTTNKAGQIQKQFWKFDNKLERADFYVEGNLHLSWLSDRSVESAVREWKYLKTWYETDGDIDFTFMVHDNGLKIWTNFEDGFATKTWVQDTRCWGGERDWYLKTTEYNMAGEVTGRITLYDDRREETEQFHDDGSMTIIQTDESWRGHRFRWESKTEEYDAMGQIESRLTIYDNGDIRAVHFDDGMRERAITVDMDNSHWWAAREVIYNENGRRIETIYHHDFDDVIDTFDFGF